MTRKLAWVPIAPWLMSSGWNWPVRVIALAESTSPISIDPLSPMKRRAGLKLWGRKPTQAPASIALSSAPVVATDWSLKRDSW